MKDLPPAFRAIAVGGELVEELDQAFDKHRGWVQATGFVEEVELKLPGETTDVRRIFRGRFALAQLAGPLGGPYGVTLSRAVGERVEVLAGVLLRARSAGVSALCTSTGDALVRQRTETLDEPLAPAVARDASARSFAQRPLTSAFAARVGVSEAAPEEEEEQAQPEPGDWVEHFAFGVCEVLSVTGDRLVLRDVRRSGRIREIASERLSITGPTEHQGKRLFRLLKR